MVYVGRSDGKDADFAELTKDIGSSIANYQKALRQH